MKKILYILLIASLLSGCEVISEQNRYIEVTIPQTYSERVHVLVEYTGFRCVNCPKAAERAHELSQLYGEKLIVVAMHPKSNPFTNGASKYDYTCPEADVYYQYMGGTAQTAFPTGNIDFKKQENSYFSDYQEWPSMVAEEMRDTTDLHIAITEVQADTATREVSFSVSAYAGTATLCQIAVWIVEDSIQGAQAMPDGTNNMEYYHRHVLRGVVGNEPWGEEIDVDTHQQTIHRTTTLPDTWNMKKCHLVAVCIAEKKQIMNAAQAAINNQ